MFSFIITHAPACRSPIITTHLLLLLQDLGDFNIATSSLHALSNTLSRTEKHSPHSSPRQSRKTHSNPLPPVGGGQGLASPAITAAASPVATTGVSGPVGAAHTNSFEAYSPSGSSSSGSGNYLVGACLKSVGGRERPLAVSSPPPLPLHTSASRMSAPVCSSAVTKALSRMPSNESSGTSFESITSPVQSKFLLHLGTTDLAPPLPPRKCLTAAKQEAKNTPTRNKCGSESAAGVPSHVRTSEDGAVSNEFEVPCTVAPPVPKHKTDPIISLAQDVGRSSIDDRGPGEEPEDGVIVGPAETISGLIDTRPLEARKPVIIKNPAQSPSSSFCECKEMVLIDRCSNGGNNLYQLKTASSPLAHARHQTLASPTTVANVTISQFGAAGGAAGGGAEEVAQKQPLLYENVSMNKDCNVSYENINLDYIERLVGEGYSKENAITALGISRNNIEMACDILHEFVSKSSV